MDTAPLPARMDALGGVRPQVPLRLNQRFDLPTRELESLVAKRRQHHAKVFQELLPQVLVGAGGIQHLTRLMDRARALEVMLNADDYDAELAARSTVSEVSTSRELVHQLLG